MDQPTQMVDGSGTTTWSYNGLHQLETLTTPQSTIHYTYNPAYRMETMREGSAPATVYGYDSARRLETLRNPLGETTAWDYDSYGRPWHQTVSSGASSVNGYDARWRLNSLVHKTSGGQVLTSESYTYNFASDLMDKTVDGVTTTYGYDDADQLITENRPGLTVGYTYDDNGNRLTRSLNGVTESYVYDPGDKLQSAGGKTFTYDELGRTKSVTSGGQTTTLGYDYEDRLTSIVHPGGAVSNYFYNGVGARVGKTTATGSNTYRRAGVGVTAPVLGDGQANYTPGISERRGGVTKFAHTDRLGSTSRLTNTAQTVTDTKSFDAFGMLVTSTGTTLTPFGFAGDYGYQTDTESGLQLLGHRYYDPSLGRFLTRDPIQSGRNWYGYCENNPLTWVDPDGCEFVVAVLVIVAIIGAVALLVKGRKYNEQFHEERNRKKDRWDRIDKAMDTPETAPIEDLEREQRDEIQAGLSRQMKNVGEEVNSLYLSGPVNNIAGKSVGAVMVLGGYVSGSDLSALQEATAYGSAIYKGGRAFSDLGKEWKSPKGIRFDQRSQIGSRFGR